MGNILTRLLGRQPTPIVVGINDRVLPLNFFERSLLVQQTNMAVLLVYDEVLDPEVLRRALEELVQLPGWEHLGGRLRKNAAKEIEWHIPKEFSTERPAITYSHVNHGTMTAAEHNIACKLPQPSLVPAVVADPDDFADLTWADGYRPRGIQDYLDKDRPVLGLRIHSFADRTVVVLQWQHVAMDAIGLKNVVEGWKAVLWKEPVPQPVPYETDPFAPLADGSRTSSAEKHLLLPKRVGLLGMLRWGLGYGVDMVLRPKDNGMICVPASFWRPQYEAAIAELRAEATAAGEDPDKVFLTENDILSAWILRVVIAAAPPGSMPPERTVAASIAMSLRKAFAGDLLPSLETDRPYVGNAFGWGNILVSVSDVRDRPLSWLACQVRRAINDQGTRTQHEAYYNLVRTSGKGLPVIIFGDGTMAQVGISNLSKAGLYDLNFAPARVSQPGSEPDLSSPCFPIYCQENHGAAKPVDGFFVLGKDRHDNYWTAAYKLKGHWSLVRKLLEKDHGKPNGDASAQ